MLARSCLAGNVYHGYHLLKDQNKSTSELNLWPEDLPIDGSTCQRAQGLASVLLLQGSVVQLATINKMQHPVRLEIKQHKLKTIELWFHSGLEHRSPGWKFCVWPIQPPPGRDFILFSVQKWHQRSNCSVILWNLRGGRENRLQDRWVTYIQDVLTIRTTEAHAEKPLATNPTNASLLNVGEWFI